jgi:hypothetical protein
MMGLFSKLLSTEVVAWWGAVIATLVLIWDVYKWKTSGPRIKFSASPDMEIIGDPQKQKEGKTYITVKAINIGGRPTTITKVGIIHYKSQFNRLIKKSDKKAIIIDTGLPYQLPYVLQPGAVWDGFIPQENVEGMSTYGQLYCVLFYSNKKRPKTARIKILKTK